MTLRFLPFVLCVARALAAPVVYDAALGTLPEAQGFTFVQEGTSPPPAVSGGLLHLGPTSGQVYWTYTTTGTDLTQDFILEAEINIISSNHIPNIGTGSREGYYFMIEDANGRSFVVGLASGGFTVNTVTFDWPPETQQLFTPYALAGDFHKLTLLADNEQEFVYIDDLLVATVNIPPSGPGLGNRVFFGSVAGTSMSESDLRYVCFDTSGLPCAPASAVPEPGAPVLGGTGLLALILSRLVTRSRNSGTGC